jgi:hypothetical protein
MLAPALAHAAAEVQKSGKEVFPGKFQLGFKPLGVQVGFNSTAPSGYKLAMDFAGLVKDYSNGLGIWVGGGLNYAAGLFQCYGGVVGCGHNVEIWAFVMLSLNMIEKIPLVPWVRAGLAGEALIFGNGVGGTTTGGGFGFRFGGGIDYWLLKFLALGVETNFTVGGAFGFVPGFSGLYGTWDMLFGMRFAF